MDGEDELSSFRNAWKQELAVNACQSRQEKAEALYREGVKLEREGYCYEAIEYYRRALQLVPDLEQQVEVAIATSEPTPESGAQYLDFQQDDEELPSTSNLGNRWTQKYCTPELNLEHAMPCLPERESQNLHISALPNEVLLMIFRYVISKELDMKSIEAISGVCKWFYKLARTPTLWQAACERIWSDLKSKDEPPNCSEFISWRGMFINRPHLRFDGIYVSRIKYFREGEQTSNLCCTLQTVFYHRFFRFFSDGLVLGLNTTALPQQAVASLKDRTSANKEVMYGQYTINGDLISLVLFQRDFSSRRSTASMKLKPDRSFKVTLKLLNKQGKQSLQWVEYQVIVKRNGQITKNDIELEPPHFCRFVFGRVKSYTALSLGTV